MKKILQKAGAFICCCLVCFQLMIQPAHAFFPAIAVSADLISSVLASLAITSGVTFTAIETFDPVVTAIKNKMNENGITDEDIQDYISNGTRLVYDVGEYAWKAVVDVPDALWWGVQQAVSALYDAGVLSLTQDNTAAVPLDGSILTLTSVDYPIVQDVPSKDWRYCYYADGSSFQYDIYYISSGTLKSTSVVITDFSYATIYYTGYSYALTLHTTSGGSSTLSLGVDPAPVYGSTTDIGSIDCASTVDQPDYDWSNEATQTKVVEFPSTYKGDPDSDDEDEKKLVLWPDIEKYLQGKDASDITSEDTSGIEDPAAQAQADPNEAVTDYTDPPAAGSESNTSLKGLLFTKFPFCIPWDIKNAFTLLVAPATPPEWEIDLVPQSIKARAHITADTTWHITMDGLEVVGTVTRWTSTIGFCLALAVATRKLIRA